MNTLRKCTVSIFLLFALTSVSLINGSFAQGKSEILVSGAISLKNALGEIGSIYETQTGVRAMFNLGASGLLQKQIEAGAPVDVFASAGVRQMDELETRNLILTETRRNLVRNSLVLVTPINSGHPVHSFGDLSDPEIGKLAIGNPRTVPAGQYARQVLVNLNLWNRLRTRLILAENVRQVLDYVVRAEVEAGIVYATDVAIAKGKVALAVTAPEETHDPILYPIAIIRETRNRVDAKRFIDLALSEAGQKVFRKYGFQSIR
jgi:molybdate transport system substrate-binding protein